METLGPINESAAQFLNDLGYRIISVSADDKEAQSLPTNLYLSAEIQRYLVARVICEWRRRGPLTVQLF